MTLDPQHKAAFEGYEKPLQSLEGAFRKAGLKITIFAINAPLGNKIVQIFKDRTLLGTVCIEGASPAQAVKDVAAAVRL